MRMKRKKVRNYEFKIDELRNFEFRNYGIANLLIPQFLNS
jgi:hypothetical protein